MKIALIYNYESPSTTGAYFERVIKKSGFQYELFGVKDPENIPSGFDLYLRIDHGDYEFDIPEYLHPAVFYVIDTHLVKPYKKIRRQCRHYDIVFCAQKLGAERLHRDTRLDIYQWIPLAADPDIHKRSELPKQYDIGFVGRNAEKADRGRHFKLLKSKYPESFIGRADFRQMGEIYSASKVGFNSSIANDINMRIFEVMACGCFLLTNRIKDNGFSEMFEEGKHLVTYGNDKELLDLAEFYLKNDSQRQQIARAGYELVLNRHTYYQRVQAMFNYIAFKFGGEFNSLRI